MDRDREQLSEHSERNRRAQPSLSTHEEWVLAGQDLERAVMLDSEGSVVTTKEGTQDQVLWTEAALGPLIGRVDLITHNHPHGSSVGLNDLVVARFLGAREVNAITTTLRYRLYRLGPNWPESVIFDGILLAEQQRLVDEMVAARAEGRISDAEIDRVFYHVFWKRVTKRFAGRIRYDVERRH
jgi:hypothetical protein